MGNIIQFFKQYFHVVAFIFLQVIALILIYNTKVYPRFAISSATQTFTAPINRMCYGVIRYFNLNSENKYLVEQNLHLLRNLQSNFLISSDSVSSVEGYVTDSLHRTKKVRLYDYISANVIYNTIHKQNNYLMIDKGSEDGIEYDMAVISAQGTVGVVSDVSAHFATVISMLNPDSKISAKVEPANQLGTIAWHFNDPTIAYLEDMPEYLNINVGDSVFTSGYSNIFPSHILIGKIVEKVKEPTNSFLTLKVQLATDFNHINSVFVVRNLYREELDTLKTNMKNE